MDRNELSALERDIRYNYEAAIRDLRQEVAHNMRTLEETIMELQEQLLELQQRHDTE